MKSLPKVLGTTDEEHGSHGRILLRAAKFAVGIVVGLVLLRVLTIGATFSVALDHIVTFFGLDVMYALPAAILLTAFALMVLPYFLWYTLLGIKGKELFVFVLLGTVMFAGASFYTKDVLFDRITGMPIRCVAKTTQGFEFGSCGDTHPIFGIPFEQITPEIAAEIALYEKHGELAKAPEADPSKCFNRLTGDSACWYVIRPSGELFISMLPGFDEPTGLALAELTPEVVEQLSLPIAEQYQLTSGRCYAKTLQGFEFGSCGDTHPLFGVAFEEITPDIAKEILFWEKHGALGTPPKAEPEKCFNRLTGEAMCWYAIRPSGELFISVLPGYDEFTGELLRPMTKAIVKKYLITSSDASEEAVENERDTDVPLAGSEMNKKSASSEVPPRVDNFSLPAASCSSLDEYLQEVAVANKDYYEWYVWYQDQKKRGTALSLTDQDDESLREATRALRFSVDDLLKRCVHLKIAASAVRFQDYKFKAWVNSTAVHENFTFVELVFACEAMKCRKQEVLIRAVDSNGWEIKNIHQSWLERNGAGSRINLDGRKFVIDLKEFQKDRLMLVYENQKPASLENAIRLHYKDDSKPEYLREQEFNLAFTLGKKSSEEGSPSFNIVGIGGDCGRSPCGNIFHDLPGPPSD